MKIKKAVITAAGAEPAGTAAADADRPRRRGEAGARHPDRTGSDGERGRDLRGRLAGRRSSLRAGGREACLGACAVRPAAGAAGVWPRGLVRARVHRPASRSCTWWATTSTSTPPESHAPQRLVEVARGGGVRRLRRAGHAREPAAALRRGRRPPRARPAGALPRRNRHREADAHRGRAAAHGARACAPGITSASSACTCSRRPSWTFWAATGG